MKLEMGKKRRDFRDRTVIVTGAAAGLGRALSLRWAAEGARIGALDVDASGLDRLAMDLGSGSASPGPRFAHAVCDLADAEGVEVAIDSLRSRLGPVDVLVNNAGITHIRAFAAESSPAARSAVVRRVLEVNFLGAVHATAACIDDVAARAGLVVVISSVAGFAPLLGRTGYCASKHALHGFFDTLRLELRHDGADVLMVCPSHIATGIRHRQAGSDAVDADGRSRVVGSEASPKAVADQVVRAALSGRRRIDPGRVARIARTLRRWAPGVYERMMLRRVRDEI